MRMVKISYYQFVNASNVKSLNRILTHSQENPQQYLFLKKCVCICYFVVPGNYEMSSFCPNFEEAVQWFQIQDSFLSSKLCNSQLNVTKMLELYNIF